MSIDLSVGNFDLWVFRRNLSVEYLLLKTSEDKAKRFFGGGRFWQIPTDIVRSNESIEDAAESNRPRRYAVCLPPQFDLWEISAF